MDLGTMKVRRAGEAIELNRACLKILEILLRASPNMVSRKDLEYALWGDMPPSSDALRSHIYTLRRKIDKPFSVPILHTVHSMGYRLGNPHEISS
jgi:DNA-binding response OmpR family regulator